MGSVSVSSCMCFTFVSWVHLVAVLNAAFGMTYSLLMLVEYERDDHMKRYTPEPFSRLSYMGVSCLHHAVAVSDFIICRGLCACTEMWLLFAFQSMFISICVFRLEITEFLDSVPRIAP